MRASCPTTGAASARSSPLPCGSPSTMSTRTTSARPASAIRWAVVAPTLPAPTTVTLLRAIALLLVGPRGAWITGLSALAGRGHANVARGIDPDRAGIPDRVAHAARVLLEVVVEHAGDPPRRGVVVSGRRPRAARLQDLRGDPGDLGRDGDLEDRIGDGRDVAKRAAQGRPDHVARVRDVHAAGSEVVILDLGERQ